ncbi:MAG: hypothetical protein IJQ00_04820 [Kiritimatiellae bacterium]|nr:hypothetical protein [Kiritimatiellia bacterium]
MPFPTGGSVIRPYRFAAKMAAFPVRPRQARSLPWRRGRSPRDGRSPYTGIAFFLHGESRLPTWRVWPRGFALAEVLWTYPDPAKRDFKEFEERAVNYRRRLIGAHVNCAPLK